MTLMKAGALILLLVVVGASIAGLALGGLGMFSGSTGERGTLTPQTDMVAQETATSAIDTSALAPETAIPPVQASAPAQVETATFALG
jgi:hypothetical protein